MVKKIRLRSSSYWESWEFVCSSITCFTISASFSRSTLSVNPLPERKRTGSQLVLGTRRKASMAAVIHLLNTKQCFTQKLRTSAREPKWIMISSSTEKTKHLKTEIKTKQTKQNEGRGTTNPLWTWLTPLVASYSSASAPGGWHLCHPVLSRSHLNTSKAAALV